MNKYYESKLYSEDALLLRVHIHCNANFAEEKLLKYIQNEEFVDSCIKCRQEHQYYMDFKLPYNYGFDLIREDLLAAMPGIARIEAGVISYKFHNLRDEIITDKLKSDMLRSRK